jgi:hypothetical protein
VELQFSFEQHRRVFCVQSDAANAPQVLPVFEHQRCVVYAGLGPSQVVEPRSIVHAGGDVILTHGEKAGFGLQAYGNRFMFDLKINTKM